MSLIKLPTARLVFDRKHLASKTCKGLVQLEITYDKKRKWISTGVKLYSDQWNDRMHVIKGDDALELNEYLNRQVMDLQKWFREDKAFSWERLDKFLSQRASASDNFLDFLEKDISERNDIRDTTRKKHRKIVSMLTEYGKIETFSDLTPVAISDLDNWLHGRKIRKLDMYGVERYESMKQQSISDYHKLMKTYIGRAIRLGLMKDDPYKNQHFKRGESEPGRYLHEDELKQLEEAVMASGGLARAKDLFLFQCYTGLSYSDLREFDFQKARNYKGDKLYSGRRKKTGVVFYFILLPKAMEILEKYGYKLPDLCLEVCNRALKKVALCAGLGKPLSTHWARRTAAMIFANHGIRMEVVAKILGHSNTLTTQKFYASITEETVAEEMKKAGLQ